MLRAHGCAPGQFPENEPHDLALARHIGQHHGTAAPTLQPFAGKVGFGQGLALIKPIAQRIPQHCHGAQHGGFAAAVRAGQQAARLNAVVPIVDKVDTLVAQRPDILKIQRFNLHYRLYLSVFIELSLHFWEPDYFQG